MTAVSGFPKAKAGGYNIENILKGQIGDDAYFVAKHVDEWSEPFASGDSPSSSSSPNPLPAESFPSSVSVLGVADGVGGWRQYGVDPGQFSKQLMYNCERLVKAGCLSHNQARDRDALEDDRAN